MVFRARSEGAQLSVKLVEQAELLEGIFNRVHC